MSWVAIIALAALAFALAVWTLRLSRSGWTLFGAALLFGLAGYAMQGSPDIPASPRQGAAMNPANGEQMVASRRQFFDRDRQPSNWIVTADAFARRGDYQRAVEFYRAAIARNPTDQEAWLALGMALVVHADNFSTPASQFAFERALEISPANGGAQYFLGLAALNSGELEDARAWWSRALAAAPADAPWREAVAFQNRRLGEALDENGFP